VRPFLAATVEGKQLLYLAVAEPKRALRVVARAGFRRELLFGATGLTLLANLPIESWSSYLPKKLPKYTRYTIVDRAKFLRRLHQVRQAGHMIEQGEYTEELVGMAVPVSWQDTLHRPSALSLGHSCSGHQSGPPESARDRINAKESGGRVSSVGIRRCSGIAFQLSNVNDSPAFRLPQNHLRSYLLACL